MKITEKSMALRRDKTALLAQARGIMDASEQAGNRDLPAAEARAVDDLLSKIDNIQAAIEREEGGKIDESSHPDFRPTGFGADDRATATTPGLLTRDQSFAAAVRQMPTYRPDTAADEQYGRFSLGRGVRGMVTGNWGNSDRERRSLMQTGSDTLGGFLLDEDYSTNLIDLARASAVLMQAGALTMPMASQTVHFPRLDSDPTPSWKHEGVEATGTNGTVGSLKLTARTLMTAIRLTVEQVEDTDENLLDAILTGAVGKAMGLEVDRVGLRGIGAGAEPMGLRNAIAGDGGTVTALGTGNGASVSIDDLSVLASTVEAQNYAPTAMVWHPNIGGQLARYKGGDGQYLMTASNLPLNIASLKKLSTTQIPINLTVGSSTDCSEIYTGDFTQLVMGVRTQIKFELLREGSIDGWSAAAGLGLIARAYLRCDFLVRRGSAFAIQTGVRAA